MKLLICCISLFSLTSSLSLNSQELTITCSGGSFECNPYQDGTNADMFFAYEVHGGCEPYEVVWTDSGSGTSCQWTTTRTYTVTDACDGEATCSAQVTESDTEPPAHVDTINNTGWCALFYQTENEFGELVYEIWGDFLDSDFGLEVIDCNVSSSEFDWDNQVHNSGYFNENISIESNQTNWCCGGSVSYLIHVTDNCGNSGEYSVNLSTTPYLCWDENACNYQDDSYSGWDCLYPGDDCNYCNTLETTQIQNSDCQCVDEEEFCWDETACNYAPENNWVDGLCYFIEESCDDGNDQTVNDSINDDCECEGNLFGCTNSEACNFNSLAIEDYGDCYFPGSDCDDENNQTVNDSINDDCECEGNLLGCTDPEACNFNSLAIEDDGSCLSIYGCIDQEALNYDPTAECEGECIYIPGDSNGDNSIDSDDLSAFLSVFGQQCEPTEFCFGDFDGDGNISVSDLTSFLVVFGTVN